MIRLIQTLFAVACVMLIAGYHFNSMSLRTIGSVMIIISMILTLWCWLLLWKAAQHVQWSDTHNVL